MNIKDIYETVEFEVNEWANKHDNLSMVFYFIFVAVAVFIMLIVPTWAAYLIIGVVCLLFSLPVLILMIIRRKEICHYTKENPKLIINWTVVLGGVILFFAVIQKCMS